LGTLEAELEKYRKAWALPEYRQWSPGADAVHVFLENTPWKPGDTIVDVGCGTGRAAIKLRDAGLRPWLLDFCAEAIEVQDLPFININIWESFDVGYFDWIYCVDVLEHLPSDKINSSLRAMFMMGRKGGYLQIACFPDSCGSLIGETLHMTVQPPEWWHEKVSQKWKINKDLSDASYARFIIGLPSKKIG
jgi:SAM-dependent methyltransferase